MTEAKLQVECYTWVHNNYPELRGLICYNLNNSRNKIDGNLNRSMGLQKGRSDMVLYGHCTARFIELKLPGEKQTTEQKQWQAKIESHGFEYYVIETLEQFKHHVIQFYNLM